MHVGPMGETRNCTCFSPIRIREPGKQAGSLVSLTDAPLLKSGLSSLAGAPSLKDPEGECASPGWPCYIIISGPGVFLRKTVTVFREALSARSHMSSVPACCVLSTRTCCLPLHCAGPTGSPRAQEGTVTCYSLDRALPASSTGQHGADGHTVACRYYLEPCFPPVALGSAEPTRAGEPC